MSLYDLIMGRGLGNFTKKDWHDLGSGLIQDEDTIKQMLMDGYGAVADDGES